jgi:hypothetical protein
MADYPPLSRFYVASYAANDRDYPVVAIRLDPRTAGYRVPEDLSPHPDSKRYPNHVFTGAQPASGDQIVTHVYEILPSPWVPFTRYDDDLGPIQGRRRDVKNEGQQADLAADKKISYEGREGSAIVSNEIEETWSIKVDEDGNSLFPLKDRDFYDASRGAVQERRQLFVPTGEEVGTLENVNGVITQTSYEPYNEFLSVKIVQTYKVDGPQLIGRATDNDGQLITVTTQRKGADGYVPPNPTATRTVEVSREDAESLIERVVDTPEIFTAKTFSVERPDPIPQKFRVAVPLQSNQEIVEGEAELPELFEGEISHSEEQRNKFIKRVSTTSRDQTVLPQTLRQKSTNNERQEVTITETLQLGNTNEVPTATKTVESEALGDGNYVIRKTEVPEVFSAKTFQKTKDDLTPQKFRGAQESNTIEENVDGIASSPSLGTGEFAKSEQQINKFVKRVSTTSRAITQAVTLLESILTPEGQTGSRTLTLASGVQTFTPSATLIDASVESLGDGRTVKTETRVPNVFAGKTVRKTKIDLTPEKFKAKQEDLTTEETVAGTVAASITLGAGEFAKSEQQVTEFVKRKSTTSRTVDQTSSLEEFVITPQGQLATRTVILAQGSQSLQPSSKLIDGSVDALGDGRSVKTEVRVLEVFDGQTFSSEKPDNIPVEFRAEKPSLVDEKTVEGQAERPDLEGTEIAKSEQQITDFLKRVRTTTREIVNAVTLKGEEINQAGQKVTIRKTLSKSEQQIAPSAKLSGDVQAIGDGYTVKTEREISTVFDQKTLSKQQPIQIPPKFINEETEEESFIEEETKAEPDELGTDGFGVTQATAQRLTEFTVRKSKTTRNGGSSLVEKQSNNSLQVVTITSEITDSPEPETLSAKIFSSKTQAIGGNKYLKETEKVDEVFDNKIISVSKADPIPEKFKVNSPTKKEEKIIEKTETDEIDSYELGEKELSKSEQRLTEFTVQETIVKREEYFNEVKSKRLEENWGINIPFKEYISDEIPDGETFEGEGLSDTQHIVREYDKTQLEQNLSAFNVQIPTSIDLDLPRVLEDIEVTWEESKSETESSTNVPDIMGAFNSLTQQDDGLLSSTLSVVPKIEVKFKDIWGKNLPAKIHLFFLKKEDLNDSEIRSKVGADENWPTFKPKSTIKTIYGKSETKELQVYVSRAMQVNDTTFGYGYQPSDGFRQKSEVRLIPVSINIPPCISLSFDIDEEKEIEFTTKEIELKYQQIFITTPNGTIPLPEVLIKKELEHKLKVEVSINIDETTPKEIPTTGTYVISSSAEPYKFGWFLVRAVTLDAAIFS